MFPILGKKPVRKRPNLQAARARRLEKPAGATVFIYGDDYSLAGYVFDRAGGAIAPVDKFNLDSLLEQNLSGAIADIAAKRPIDLLIVPPAIGGAGLNNSLFQSLPAGYPARIARENPTFPSCCEVRAAALKDGRLIEEGYSGAEKLIEQLKQCRESKPATKQLWAYLAGVYELAGVRPARAEDFYAPSSFERDRAPY